MDASSFEEYRLRNPELRYGQAFCNYYRITDTVLFYETDEKKARELAAVYAQNYQWNL